MQAIKCGRGKSYSCVDGLNKGQHIPQNQCKL
uniref:Uncharacterized protein n=1 Tax=Tetraselmis sp. GSL018 TaxID=582737 RepID=A0A061RXA3_9CHLO